MLIILWMIYRPPGVPLSIRRERRRRRTPRNSKRNQVNSFNSDPPSIWFVQKNNKKKSIWPMKRTTLRGSPLLLWNEKVKKNSWNINTSTDLSHRDVFPYKNIFETFCKEKMVTSLLLLLHRRHQRIRSRWIPSHPLQSETRTTRWRTLQEPFTINSRSPQNHPFSMPRSSRPSFRKKRNRHPVGLLGILQVSRQGLFCVLRFTRCSPLPRLRQTSTSSVLLPTTHRQDEMSLLRRVDHEHVPHREKPREIILQVFQVNMSFLPMGGWRPPRKKSSLARSRQVHLPLWRKTGQAQLTRCLVWKPPPKRCKTNH